MDFGQNQEANNKYKYFLDVSSIEIHEEVEKTYSNFDHCIKVDALSKHEHWELLQMYSGYELLQNFAYLTQDCNCA